MPAFDSSTTGIGNCGPVSKTNHYTEYYKIEFRNIFSDKAHDLAKWLG